MQAVQLHGRDQVLMAYDNWKIDVWAIYQGRNLLTKGCGDKELEAFLDLLSKNATRAVYTLKVYEDLDDAKKVKEKTESSGSLSFNLGDEDFTAVGSLHYESTSANYRMHQKIEELTKQVKELKEGGSQPQTLEEAAIGMLGNPGELAQLIIALKQLFTPGAPQLPTTNYSPYPQPGALGNTGEQAQRVYTDEEISRLQRSIDVLQDNDPKLLEHMEKLAAIAKENPSQWKLLLTMLENS